MVSGNDPHASKKYRKMNAHHGVSLHPKGGDMQSGKESQDHMGTYCSDE